MNKLLETIFETKKFQNSNNQIVEIHSETSKKQCEFLQQLITAHKFSKSLEIGFAYGISTLAIIEEVAKNGGRHLVIDKFQHDAWSGNGLELIKQAGYSDQLDFIEEYCYVILPKLLEAGKKFDFVYVDSTKQFDWLLVNFFYIDKVLDVNGIVVFDDVAWTSIRKLLRYISQFPNYKVYSQFPENYAPTKARELTELLKHLPKSEKYLKEDIIKSDYQLGINCSCVALIKVGEDKRNWDWHINF